MTVRILLFLNLISPIVFPLSESKMSLLPNLYSQIVSQLSFIFLAISILR